MVYNYLQIYRFGQTSWLTTPACQLLFSICISMSDTGMIQHNSSAQYVLESSVIYFGPFCHRSVLRAQAPFKIKMLNPYAITPSHQEKILAKLWNQNNRDFHFVLAFSPFHCHKEIILEKSMYKKFAHIYFMNCLFSVVICLWNIIYWLELVANICYFLFSNSFICECGWYVQSQK